MAKKMSIIIEDENDEINALTLAKLLAQNQYKNLELIEFVDGAVYFVDNEYTREKQKYYKQLLNEFKTKDDILIVDVFDSYETNTLIFKIKTEN